MRSCLLVFACLWGFQTAWAAEKVKPLLPIPDKLVVLTFDDGNKSDIAYVAPLLKRHGFGATFFITEGLGFLKDKKTFLTWDEIPKLHEAGRSVYKAGKFVKGVAGITTGIETDDYVTFDVGSGSYAFQLTGQK